MPPRKKEDTKESQTTKKAKEAKEPKIETERAIVNTETTNSTNTKFEHCGKTFRYKSFEFIALDGIDNGILAITTEILPERLRFADNNDFGSNDWRKSSIRKKLNTDYLKMFDANDLLPITSDLTADTGETNYGNCEDLIAMPSDAVFRKFNRIIPNYKTWVWSITPWAIEYSNMSAVSARTQAKTIYSESPNKELGVVLLCVFKPEKIDLN